MIAKRALAESLDEPTQPTPPVVRPLLAMVVDAPPSALEASPALAVARQHLASARDERDRARRRQLLQFARWALDDACEAAAPPPPAVNEALALLAELEQST